ncbi:hypothetical protein V1477_011800 [Vespula maculifrons]|uniref:Uncharacterized protein n=1 Tax=Vespula maculifrons TaxID=7453 RepID=A0ABD2C093_VESMC
MLMMTIRNVKTTSTTMCIGTRANSTTTSSSNSNSSSNSSRSSSSRSSSSSSSSSTSSSKSSSNVVGVAVVLGIGYGRIFSASIRDLIQVLDDDNDPIENRAIKWNGSVRHLHGEHHCGPILRRVNELQRSEDYSCTIEEARFISGQKKTQLNCSTCETIVMHRSNNLSSPANYPISSYLIRTNQSLNFTSRIIPNDLRH